MQFDPATESWTVTEKKALEQSCKAGGVDEGQIPRGSPADSLCSWELGSNNGANRGLGSEKLW